MASWDFFRQQFEAASAQAQAAATQASKLAEVVSAQVALGTTPSPRVNFRPAPASSPIPANAAEVSHCLHLLLLEHAVGTT